VTDELILGNSWCAVWAGLSVIIQEAFPESAEVSDLGLIVAVCMVFMSDKRKDPHEPSSLGFIEVFAGRANLSTAVKQGGVVWKYLWHPMSSGFCAS
jgi:hypothetical protein